AGRQRNPLRQPNALGNLPWQSLLFFISWTTLSEKYFYKIRQSKKAAPERAAFLLSEYFLEATMNVGILHLEAVRNVLAGQLAIVGVDRRIDRLVSAAGFFQAVRGDLEAVAQGGVGQRNGGGARNSARHIADAVMDDSIHLIDRIVVVGHVGGLTAATLVNRDVDDDRTGAHLFQIRFSDNLRCLLAGDQHRADNQVGCLQRVFDVDVVGVKG